MFGIISEVRRTDRNHVGPSGLNCFVGCRLPRPDGRGYCMTALRACEPKSDFVGGVEVARERLLDHENSYNDAE